MVDSNNPWLKRMERQREIGAVEEYKERTAKEKQDRVQTDADRERLIWQMRVTSRMLEPSPTYKPRERSSISIFVGFLGWLGVAAIIILVTVFVLSRGQVDG